MKIIFATSTTVRGGGEEYLLSMARHVASSGHDVTLLCGQNSGTESLIEDCAKAGAVWCRHDFVFNAGGVINKVKTYLMEPCILIVKLARLRPDIVQVNLCFFWSCVSLMLACAVLRIPLQAVFHNAQGDDLLNFKKKKLYDYFLRKGQKWVTVSNANALALARTFGVAEGVFEVIHNGIDVGKFDFDPTEREKARKQLRKEFGWNEGARVAITVGRLYADKGWVELMEAAPGVLEAFPDLHFLWVGEGELYEILRADIETRNLQNRIRLAGYRKDVASLLAGSDLMVCPSRRECLPFVVQEAMAARIPIVACAVGGIPELIENGIHGLLVESENATALKEGIIKVLKDGIGSKERSEKAFKRVSELFQEERMHRETEKRIADLRP